MKKHFLNIGWLFVAVLTISVFNSCKDEPNIAFVIKAENVIGAPLGVRTAAVEWFKCNDDASFCEAILYSEAPFRNSGFELRLPGNISAEHLTPISEDVLGGVSISNKNANWIIAMQEISILGLDALDNPIGGFFYGFIFETMTQLQLTYAGWAYVDRDVNVNGIIRDGAYTERFDLNLKKGWNTIYVNYVLNTRSATFAVTTRPPANAEFEWRFFGNRYFYSTDLSTKIKSFERENSFFNKLINKQNSEK
jgi:hypothetical protein